MWRTDKFHGIHVNLMQHLGSASLLGAGSISGPVIFGRNGILWMSDSHKPFAKACFTALHEIHETCNSVGCYFMKKKKMKKKHIF